MVVEKKRQGSATRAFSDRAASKPRGLNRTIEITAVIVEYSIPSSSAV